MNPDKEVFQALLKSGLRGTKRAWQEGHAPPLPWFVYMRRMGGEVMADDSNFAELPRYCVELYQREDDPSVREAIEGAMRSADGIGPYTAYEDWIPTEQCLMTSYYFTFHPKETTE